MKKPLIISIKTAAQEEQEKTRKPRWSVAKRHALSANRHLRKTSK